jgi:hypothetical protein
MNVMVLTKASACAKTQQAMNSTDKAGYTILYSIYTVCCNWFEPWDAVNIFSIRRIICVEYLSLRRIKPIFDA